MKNEDWAEGYKAALRVAAELAKGKCGFDENPYCEGRWDASQAITAHLIECEKGP